ncbi:MAG: PKD domain-containing protein, partial [Bacteroidota bacterium]
MRTSKSRYYTIFSLLFLQTVFWTALVGQNCNANFNVEVVGCNTVNFVASDQNPGLTHLWDFGDGSSAIGVTVQHTYVSFGNGTADFTATLTVSGNACATATSDETIMVDQVPDPTITDVSGDNFLSCSTPWLQIGDGSTTQSTNVNYSLTFEGGLPSSFSGSSLNSVQVNFQTDGVHPIIVEVTGENGCVSVDTVFFVFSAQPAIGTSLASQDEVCLPGEFVFSIVDVENNTPNTTYLVETNYGFSQTYSHPPPASISLDLNDSSCGTNYTINNGNDMVNDAFQVTVIAMTGCPNQESDGSVGPIRTITPPTADFDILPDDEGCVGDQIEFRNTSISGLFWDNLLDDCTDRMAALWDISPSTGFTITSGSLQDSAGFTAIFNQPGVYTVEMTIANEVTANPFGPTDPNFSDAVCGADIAVKTLCILPNPQSSFASNYSPSCFPTIIEPMNTSNTLGACGSTEYTWIVNFLNSECGNLGGHSFLNGTSASSVDPEIQFDSSGLYELLLVVANECGIDTARQELEVASSPFTQINPIPDSCFYGSMSVQPSLAISAGCFALPTYVWTFPGGSPSSFNGAAPPPIGYGQAGTYTITVETTNDCGISTTSETFTLFEPPSVPNISHTDDICVGQNIVFSNSNPGNLTYSWSGPNGFVSSNPSPMIANATIINEGAYTVTVSDANGCMDIETYPVTVGNNATLMVTPNPDTICIGQTSTLTAS